MSKSCRFCSAERILRLSDGISSRCTRLSLAYLSDASDDAIVASSSIYRAICRGKLDARTDDSEILRNRSLY